MRSIWSLHPFTIFYSFGRTNFITVSLIEPYLNISTNSPDRFWNLVSLWWFRRVCKHLDEIFLNCLGHRWKSAEMLDEIHRLERGKNQDQETLASLNRKRADIERALKGRFYFELESEFESAWFMNQFNVLVFSWDSENTSDFYLLVNWIGDIDLWTKKLKPFHVLRLRFERQFSLVWNRVSNRLYQYISFL